MNVLYILIGVVIGMVFTGGIVFAIFWEKFSDYGGSILIDDKTMVNRLYLNNSMEDWINQKYIIFKVAKAAQPLKRLNDIDDMDLEEKDETN